LLLGLLAAPADAAHRLTANPLLAFVLTSDRIRTRGIRSIDPKFEN